MELLGEGITGLPSYSSIPGKAALPAPKQVYVWNSV